MASTKIVPAPLTRPIREIAAEIKADFHAQGKPVHPWAAPYVQAMFSLETLDDRFYEDPATDVVNYALSNLETWRGETARRVKAELKAALAHRRSQFRQSMGGLR